MSAVIHPGETISPGLPVPDVRVPDREVFLRRAARFRQLASGHAVGPYLAFMGDLAAAQHELFEDGDNADNLHPESLRREMAFAEGPTGGALHAMLHRFLQRLAPLAPAPTQAVIRNLLDADEDAIVNIAAGVLQDHDKGRDPIAAPLVAAVLQVRWARRASALSPKEVITRERAHVCPVCGSPPVASVVHANGTERGVRYLHCALCETEWRLARIQCSHCDSEKAVVYVGVEGSSEAAKAEACDACGTYLKIFHQEKDQDVDPVADDLASLGLDLAMADAGYARTGPNLLFVPGEERH